MNRLLAVLLLVVSPACRCNDGTSNVTTGFRAAPNPVEFGRVLEGGQATQTVTITSTGAASLTISAATQAPFTVDSTIELPAGSDVALPVTFTAANTEATGTLTLTSGKKSLTVTLHATGVRPPSCTPSGPCIISTYSVQDDRCLETQAADESACDPGNVCLELGRCKLGQCLGVARSCDDNNLCTIDGCSSSGGGCVHPQRTCPAPSNPCHVATCDPKTGCGEGLAGDGTPCGALDCTTANLCVRGTCTAIPTPDGTPCGNALACLPAGTCQSKQCKRPDAGEWVPDWSATLHGVPSEQLPAMLSNGSSLFFPMCGLEKVVDGGSDAGLDGGVDGGIDAGELDAGDAGEVDAGDAGDPDAGDAGPFDDGGVCGLVSYTLSGFDRYSAVFDDGRARRLVHVAPRGVLVMNDGGLEYRSLSNGAVRERLGVTTSIDSIAYAADASVIIALADGTLAIWPNSPDAGLVPVASLGSEQVLSLDSDGTLYGWNPDAGVLSRVRFDADGGLSFSAVTVDAGTRSLTVAGGQVVAGAGTTVSAADDGGWLVTPLDHQQFDTVWPSRSTLQTTSEVAMFGLRCPMPLLACADDERALWVSVNSLRTGAESWAFQAVPNLQSRVIEAALVNLPTSIAVAELAEIALDGGHRSALGIISDAGLTLLCPLPVESTSIHSALFVGSSMLVLVQRPDAGYALESYGLNSLPVHTFDWRAPEGTNGWRRAQ